MPTGPGSREQRTSPAGRSQAPEGSSPPSRGHLGAEPRRARPPAHQRLQLLGVDEAELLDEVVEVLVAGVDVRLGAHVRNAVEVVDVHVHEHAEQPRQDLPHGRQEGPGERRACAGGRAQGPARRGASPRRHPGEPAEAREEPTAQLPDAGGGKGTGLRAEPSPKAPASAAQAGGPAWPGTHRSHPLRRLCGALGPAAPAAPGSGHGFRLRRVCISGNVYFSR